MAVNLDKAEEIREEIARLKSVEDAAETEYMEAQEECDKFHKVAKDALTRCSNARRTRLKLQARISKVGNHAPEGDL